MPYPGLTEVFLYDAFGVVTGSATDIQFPTGSCGMLRFKADPANSGVFLIGNEFGTLFPLNAGDDTDFFMTTNLNRYYYSHRTTGTTDFAYWFLQK